MLKWLARLLFYKIFFRVEVVNYENIKDVKGGIMCPNHTTWMDGVFMWAIKGRKMYAMAKAEIFKNPIVGWFCKNGPSFGYTLSPVKFSAQDHSTSELLRTL